MLPKEETLSTDIPDMSEDITNLKKALEKNRLTLRNKIVAPTRPKLKKDLVKFQDGLNSIVEGENPEHIHGIPNEIWELIFEQFDDAKDVQNCYNTCQQFRSSSSTSQRTLIQLRKTLPILLKTGYLTHNEILNLRLTSKPVNKCVDQFFQSKKLSWKKSFPPIEYDLMPYCYNCSLLEILMRDTLRNVSKGRAIIRYQVLNFPQTRNPFLSRYVMIHDTTGLNLDRFRRWDDQVVEFLQIWGKHIWYLTLRMNCSKKRFLDVLKLMPNLVHLKITGSITDDGHEFSSSYNKLIHEACPKLTSLVFPGPTKLIAGVRNNLISTFSNRLTEFSVETWESLYSEFYWPSLKKLVVKRCSWVVDLCNCRADNLEELSVHLSGNENFDLFLRMVNNFPKLDVLEVNFGEKFEMRDEQVIKKIIEDKVFDKGGGSKVKRLTVKMQVCDKVSFSILACFPMLEYLVIEKEFGTEDMPRGVDLIHDFLYRNDKTNEEDDKGKKVELVEIDKFLVKKKQGSLEKSNVWKVLPFLRKIQVNNLSYDNGYVSLKPWLN